MPHPPTLVYLTRDIPGVGGVIKQRDEDFLVDEQPLYEPSGAGEHLYLFIERHGMTTTDVVRRLARTFHVGRSDIGYAGLKDKHAFTRQHFSVYLPDASHDQELLPHVDAAQIKLLWAQRHANKLRRGHLAGNRFVIRVREVLPAGVLGAKRVLDRLAVEGVPNYVGEQRFGYRKDNAQLGGLLLRQRWQEMLDLMLGQPRETDFPATRAGREAYERKDYVAALEAWPRHLHHERQGLDALRQGKTPERAVMAIDRQQREFLVSAMQSAIFNQVLSRRIAEGTLGRLVGGDLAWKHDSRAVFPVDQAVADLENGPGGRVPVMALSPSGPMWGPGMLKPAGVPLQHEEEALASFGLGESDLVGGPHANSEGSRRPLRTPIQDIDISGGADDRGPFVRLAFSLPRGCFATAALREVMKTDAHTHPDDPEVEG